MAVSKPLLLAAGWGALAGIRSFAPLGLYAGRGGVRGAGAALLASPWVTLLVRLAALGEAVADKSSRIPSRTDPLPLAGRAGTGALVGAAVAADAERPRLAGAAVGAASAVASAFAFHALRGLLDRRLPNAVAGLAEDAVVLGAGVLLRAA